MGRNDYLGHLLLNRCHISLASEIFLLAALGLVACGGETEESASERQTQGAFTAIAIFGEKTEASHNFLEDEVFLCMKQEGFEYRLQPFGGEREPPDTLERRREVGFGYSGSVPFEVEESFQTDDEFFPASVASEADRGVYFELLASCREQASEAMNREVSSFIEGLGPEDREMYRSVIEFDHPDLLAAEGLWSTCMAGEGFSFASPITMLEYALETYVDETTKAEEIELAVADWECFSSREVSELTEGVYSRLDDRMESGLLNTLKEGT